MKNSHFPEVLSKVQLGMYALHRPVTDFGSSHKPDWKEGIKNTQSDEQIRRQWRYGTCKYDVSISSATF